jgi:hypothetical protein
MAAIGQTDGWVRLATCASVDESVALQHRLWELGVAYRVDAEVAVMVPDAATRVGATALDGILLAAHPLPRAWVVRGA